MDPTAQLASQAGNLTVISGQKSPPQCCRSMCCILYLAHFLRFGIVWKARKWGPWAPFLQTVEIPRLRKMAFFTAHQLGLLSLFGNDTQVAIHSALRLAGLTAEGGALLRFLCAGFTRTSFSSPSSSSGSAGAVGASA